MWTSFCSTWIIVCKQDMLIWWHCTSFEIHSHCSAWITGCANYWLNITSLYTYQLLCQRSLLKWHSSRHSGSHSVSQLLRDVLEYVPMAKSYQIEDCLLPLGLKQFKTEQYMSVVCPIYVSCLFLWGHFIILLKISLEKSWRTCKETKIFILIYF